MERFAHRYCELNPSIFQHPDTCFVLSFAIIMLNTSLHNPAVKDKQTIEQFITMNRGIDNGDDLPRELLEVSVCCGREVLTRLLYLLLNETSFQSQGVCLKSLNTPNKTETNYIRNSGYCIQVVIYLKCLSTDKIISYLC